MNAVVLFFLLLKENSTRSPSPSPPPGSTSMETGGGPRNRICKSNTRRTQRPRSRWPHRNGAEPLVRRDGTVRLSKDKRKRKKQTNKRKRRSMMRLERMDLRRRRRRFDSEMSADLIDLIDQSRTTDVALEWTTSASSECSFGSVRLQSSWKESPSRYHKDVDIGPPNWLSANARFAVPHSLWFVRQLGFDDAKRKPKRNSEPTTRVRVLRLVTIAAGRFARNGWFSLGWPAAMDCVVVVVDSTIVDSQGDRRLLLSTERSDRQNPRRRVCVRALVCVS